MENNNLVLKRIDLGMVEIDRIMNYPYNSDDRTNGLKNEELVSSIKSRGVINAIILIKIPTKFGRQAGGKFWMALDGHKRKAACKKAGLKTIPAVQYVINQKYSIEDTFKIINGLVKPPNAKESLQTYLKNPIAAKHAIKDKYRTCFEGFQKLMGLPFLKRAETNNINLVTAETTYKIYRAELNGSSMTKEFSKKFYEYYVMYPKVLTRAFAAELKFSNISKTAVINSILKKKPLKVMAEKDKK